MERRDKMVEKGDVIRIGPWTYRVCRAQAQDSDGVLIKLKPIRNEKEE
jgi:nucleoside 2-deoxyribosyltransferase